MLDRGGRRGVPLWGVALVLAASCGLSLTVASRLERTLSAEPEVYGAAAPAKAPPKTPPSSAPVQAAATAPKPSPPPVQTASAAPARPAPAPILRHPFTPRASAQATARPAAKAPNAWTVYVAARQAYDARERTEGFLWAKQYRVAVSAYCQAGERRDPAFVQGCLDYLKS
jgi:hypothetical protein